MKDFIPVRNPMRARNVERLLLKAPNLFYTIGFILVKSHISVKNVGKPLFEAHN